MPGLSIDKIIKMCKNKSLRWTHHIFTRLVQRGISIADIEYVLLNGVIIEQYPDDYPYPSALVFGVSKTAKPMHVVCGLSEKELWLITSYYPDIEDWEPDFKTRKEKTK